MSPGRVAYQPFPGSNGLEKIWFDSLSVGIAGFLEVGTVPITYFRIKGVTDNAQGWNANAKLTLYRGEFAHFGVGASHFHFSQTLSDFISNVKDENGNPSPITPDMAAALGIPSAVVFQYTSVLIALNVFPSRSAFSFGLNLNYGLFKSNWAPMQAVVDQNPQPVEAFLDTAWRVSEDWALTTGVGTRKTQQTASNITKAVFGYGESVTWLIHSGFVSRLSLGGFYQPEIRHFQVVGYVTL